MNKIPDSNFNWLRDELPQLVEKGCLEPAAAKGVLEQLRTRLDDGSAMRTAFASIVSALGAIFLMTGVILLLGHNWDTLSKGTRLSFSIAPLAICQLLGGYILLKGKGIMWREPVASVLPIALLAAIALVAQVYQITGDGRTTYLITVALTLPVFYLFNSIGSFQVYLVLMTLFGFASCDLWASSHEKLDSYWLLWLGLLPFLFLRLRRGGVASFGGYWVRVGAGLALFCGLIMCFMNRSFDWKSTLFVCSLVFCLLYSLGRMVGEGQCRERARIWSMMGKFVPSVCLATAIIADSMKVTHEHFFDTMMFFAICGGIWIGGLLLSVKGCDVDWFVNSSVFLLVLLGQASTHYALFGLLGLGAFHLVRGMQTKSYGLMNWGVLVLLTALVVELFNYDIDFVVRGWILISAGVALFAINVLMFRQFKAMKGAL